MIEQAKQIIDFNEKMERMCLEVWALPEFGEEIKACDYLKNNLANNLVKKYGHIYSAPQKEFDAYEKAVGEAFYSVWEKIHSAIQNGIFLRSMQPKSKIKLMAYLHYHYKGWILKKGKK